MRNYIHLLFPAVCICALSPLAQAQITSLTEGTARTAVQAGKIEQEVARSIQQISRSVVPPIFSTPQLTAAQTVQISKQLLANARLEKNFLGVPKIEPLEKHIHRFVFTITPINDPQRVTGNGFVFAEEKDGQTVLWGLTTAQTAEISGEDVLVSFHADQHVQSFHARIVQSSNPEGSNTALIELPPTVADVALPIQPAERLSQEKPKHLLSYGIDNHGFVHKQTQRLFFSGSERLIAENTPGAPQQPMGGLVVNEKGQALGIYNTGYDLRQKYDPWLPAVKEELHLSSLWHISEITPLRHTNYLLREYRQPHSAARVILFDGLYVGKMELNEHINAIYIRRAGEKLEKLPRNPFWSLGNLDRFIPDFQNVQTAYIAIEGGEEGSYFYQINLLTRSVRKINSYRNPVEEP